MKKPNKLLIIVNILWASALVLSVPIYFLIAIVSISLYPDVDGISSAAGDNFFHPIVATQLLYLTAISILTVILNIRAIATKKVVAKKYITLLTIVIILALMLCALTIYLLCIWWLPELAVYFSA